MKRSGGGAINTLTCIHEFVCEYCKSEIGCDRLEICKYFIAEPAGNSRASLKTDTMPKRHYRKRQKSSLDDPEDIGDLIKHFEPNEKQIAHARTMINQRRDRKQLTENQCLALDTLKGIRFPKLTSAQKEQIMNIYNDSTPGKDKK